MHLKAIIGSFIRATRILVCLFVQLIKSSIIIIINCCLLTHTLLLNRVRLRVQISRRVGHSERPLQNKQSQLSSDKLRLCNKELYRIS